MPPHTRRVGTLRAPVRKEDEVRRNSASFAVGAIASALGFHLTFSLRHAKREAKSLPLRGAETKLKSEP